MTSLQVKGFLRAVSRIAMAYGVVWIYESVQRAIACIPEGRHTDDTQGKAETERTTNTQHTHLHVCTNI